MSCKMRAVPAPPDSLCFLTQNPSCVHCDCKFKWHATNRSQIRIFFQLKRASRKPFQIQCVFSSNARLAFNVTINLFDSQPTAPTFRLFFRRKRAPQESCHIPQVHFHCVFSGTMCLGFTSQCEFTCDAASPCRISFLFPRENAPRRNHQEVSKLEERHMLTKGFSHVCVERKKSDAAASTWAKDPQAPKKNQLPREDMWKRRVVNKHHQYSCCGQKHVFTYVVGGRVGMNETCYFTCDMKKLVLTPLPPPVDVDCGFSCGWEMWPLSLHCLMMIDVEWSGAHSVVDMDGSDQIIIIRIKQQQWSTM